jgi:hypothetical protein
MQAARRTFGAPAGMSTPAAAKLAHAKEHVNSTTLVHGRLPCRPSSAGSTDEGPAPGRIVVKAKPNTVQWLVQQMGCIEAGSADGAGC